MLGGASWFMLAHEGTQIYSMGGTQIYSMGRHRSTQWGGGGHRPTQYIPTQNILRARAPGSFGMSNYFSKYVGGAGGGGHEGRAQDLVG